MAVHNLEISTDNLLNVVVQMPEKEFDRFFKKVSELRKKGKNGKISPKESEMIYKINTIIPTNLRERYNELYDKFRHKTLSEAENQELLKLNDELEMLNAERLKYIGKLAKLRGQTLEEVIQDLKIKTSSK
jgi:hypothetical protein